MGGIIDNVPVERDFNVSFSIEDVKSAMHRLDSKSIRLKIKNKNDVFNSYSMEMVDGLTIVRPTIQLKKISDLETNVFMNCVLREGNMISQNELLDNYFNLLSTYLSGDEEAIKLHEVQSNKGCFGIILIGFGLFTSTLYYIMS
jgi:hypothetical protein